MWVLGTPPSEQPRLLTTGLQEEFEETNTFYFISCPGPVIVTLKGGLLLYKHLSSLGHLSCQEPSTQTLPQSALLHAWKPPQRNIQRVEQICSVRRMDLSLPPALWLSAMENQENSLLAPPFRSLPSCLGSRAPSQGHISRGRLSEAALWVPSWHKLLLKHPDSEIRFEWDNLGFQQRCKFSGHCQLQGWSVDAQEEHQVQGQDLGSSLLFLFSSVACCLTASVSPYLHTNTVAASFPALVLPSLVLGYPWTIEI